MKYKMNKPAKKPKDWPANAIECQLDNIHIQMEKFKKEPNYKNKEVLLSLVSDYDLNQRSMLGLLRNTEYEVACINSLFVEAHLHQFNGLKTYLYELVGNKTRMQKITSWFTIRYVTTLRKERKIESNRISVMTHKHILKN